MKNIKKNLKYLVDDDQIQYLIFKRVQFTKKKKICENTHTQPHSSTSQHAQLSDNLDP